MKTLTRGIGTSAVVAATSLYLATAAEAATVTTDYNLSALIVPYTPTNTTISVAKFDPTLGTLTGVSLVLTTTAGGDIHVYCFVAPGPCSAPFASELAGVLTIGGISVSSTATSTATFTFPSGESIRDLAPVTTSNTTLSSQVGTLAGFTGTGSVAGNLQINSRAGCTGLSGNTCLTGVGYYGYGMEDQALSLRVIYDYSVGSVPEPSTWAMMLFGFSAVGFAMRRHSQKVLQYA